MSTSESVAVVSKRCTGCGVCISQCPEKALEFLTVEFVKKALCVENLCTGCGLCVPHCRFHAIEIGKKKPAHKNRR